jgi:hypothetical protein
MRQGSGVFHIPTPLASIAAFVRGTSTGMWLRDRKCGREDECEPGMITVGLALPFDDEASRSTATRSPTRLLASARECN